MTRMTGQWVIKQSIFGTIEPGCETLDGRNIGQMQEEAAAELDAFIERIPQVVGQFPNRIAAHVGGRHATQTMMRKLWGSQELSVYVERNGRKAIQGVKYGDIAETIGNYAANMWDAAKK